MDKAKRTLFGLSLGHFTIDLYAAILIPLYPIIAQRLNITLAKISLVIAIGHSVVSFLQPLFGYISDKIKTRFFMFWGLVFSAIFIPFGFIAPNSFILTMCLILGIAGNAFYHPQTTLMIKNYHKEGIALSHAIGVFLGLGTIGYAFAPYLSTFFLKLSGEKNYIYIFIFGIIISFFMLFFVPKINTSTSTEKSNFIFAIKDILKNKICIFLIIITVIKSALVMSYGTYIPFLLKKTGFELTQTGLILTLFYIAGGISMIISSKIEKILKLKGMIFLSYFPILPLTVLALYLLKINKIIASFIFIIIGFFVLLAAGIVLAHAQKTVSNQAGTISGIIQGFTLALGSLFLIPFGIIGEHFGIEIILILISSIAFIASLFSIKTKII